MKQYERRDHYQELTDRVLAELEKGRIPWHRPWDADICAGPQAPINGVTGRPYHGINVLALGLDPRAFMTSDPRWCTYQQAKEAGMQVRKGEKATTIFFAKPLEVANKEADPNDTDTPATRLIHLLRAYSVFHMGTQIENAPAYKTPTVDEAPWTRPEAARIILADSGAVIRVGGDKAFYSPATDHIQLPPDSAFDGPPQWCATAMHELSHWTGAKHRLDRDISGGFGSAKYAEEELVAELASYFTCSTLNLPTDCTQNAAYIGHWKTKLKSDNRAIFKAAALAQKATDFVLDFHPDFSATVQADAAPAPLDHVLPTSALPRPTARPEQPAT